MGFFLYVFITCSEDTLKIANVLNKLNVPYLMAHLAVYFISNYFMSSIASCSRN